MYAPGLGLDMIAAWNYGSEAKSATALASEFHDGHVFGLSAYIMTAGMHAFNNGT